MRKIVRKVYGKDKKLLKVVYSDGEVYEYQKENSQEGMLTVNESRLLSDSNINKLSDSTVEDDVDNVSTTEEEASKQAQQNFQPINNESLSNDDFLTSIVKERTLSCLAEDSKEFFKNIYQKIKRIFMN